MTRPCVTPEQLDTLLRRLSSIRDNWDAETGEMKERLERAGAGGAERIRDSLKTTRRTGESNAERWVVTEILMYS